MILKGSDAARYRNQVSFCIAEGVENAQRFVATGDEVLNQEIAIVVRGAHVLPHLCKLCGRFDLVSFSFVGNIRILELRGVGGLCYTGARKSIEAEAFQGLRACAEIPGFRMRDGKLVAELIEAAFLRDGIQERKIIAGNEVSCFFKTLLSS